MGIKHRQSIHISSSSSSLGISVTEGTPNMLLTFDWDTDDGNTHFQFAWTSNRLHDQSADPHRHPHHDRFINLWFATRKGRWKNRTHYIVHYSLEMSSRPASRTQQNPHLSREVEVDHFIQQLLHQENYQAIAGSLLMLRWINSIHLLHFSFWNNWPSWSTWERSWRRRTTPGVSKLWRTCQSWRHRYVQRTVRSVLLPAKYKRNGMRIEETVLKDIILAKLCYIWNFPLAPRFRSQLQLPCLW